MSYRSRARAIAGAGVMPCPRVLSRTLLVSLLALAGCETASTKPLFDDDSPASLQISMARAEVDRGDTIRVEAVVLNRGGAPIGSPSAGAPRQQAPVTWSSSDPSVANISRSGLVSAHRGGEVTITATTGTLVSASRLKVLPRGKLLTLTPKVDTLEVGHALQLSAMVLSLSNSEVPGALLNWTSLQPSVASVDAKGLVKAIATGTALIVAGAHGYADTARVVVASRTISQLPIAAVASVEIDPGEASLQVGAARQFRATVKDGGGSPVSTAVPVWTSSDAAVASVDNAGVVTPHAAGSATIRATVQGISGAAAVSVSAPAPAPPVVTTIEVSPATATVERGNAVQLSATVRDQNGGVMSGVSVAWSSGNTAVATVDANGRVSAVAEGIASIRASAQDRTGHAAVTVIRPASPPPAFPNRPAGHSAMTLHTADPWPAWWKHDGNNNITAHSLPGQPFEGPAVRYRFPRGLPGGVGPAMMGYGWQSLGEPGNIRVNGQLTRDLYIAFWYRASENFHLPLAQVAKLFYVYSQTDQYRGAIFPRIHAPGLTPGAPMWMSIEIEGPPSTSILNANRTPVSLLPGRWYFMEYHMTNAAAPDPSLPPGIGYGSFRWWVDGVLVGDHPQVPRPAHAFTEVHWNPVWGGGGGHVIEDIYAWFGRIYVSGRPD
jgi:uncharacterized protein YjdB